MAGSQDGAGTLDRASMTPARDRGLNGRPGVSKKFEELPDSESSGSDDDGDGDNVLAVCGPNGDNMDTCTSVAARLDLLCWGAPAGPPKGPRIVKKHLPFVINEEHQDADKEPAVFGAFADTDRIDAIRAYRFVDRQSLADIKEGKHAPGRPGGGSAPSSAASNGVQAASLSRAEQREEAKNKKERQQGASASNGSPSKRVSFLPPKLDSFQPAIAQTNSFVEIVGSNPATSPAAKQNSAYSARSADNLNIGPAKQSSAFSARSADTIRKYTVAPELVRLDSITPNLQPRP